MIYNSKLHIVDRIIPLLGNLDHGNEVGIQIKDIYVCIDDLKRASNWTLGHALASIKLRALAAGFAREYLSSDEIDIGSLERMKGAFHELRTYVAADVIDSSK